MLSSVEANSKIEPSMGPMHGVHPKANAIPTVIELKKPFLFSVENLFSKFRNFKLTIPMKWSEKIIIIIPAKILSSKEFFNKSWPINEAANPKIINIIEKPSEKQTTGIKLIFFFF